MRMKSIVVASAAVAILAVSAASVDARSRHHRTIHDTSQDEITRQLNLEQLAKAQGSTMQQAPATNQVQPYRSQPTDQNYPEPEQQQTNPPTY